MFNAYTNTLLGRMFMSKKIDMLRIQELREVTGLGMMDCKKALEETDGDIEKAIELLRKKGAAVAAKRAGKETAQGVIQAYIHPGSRVGVMIELNCETDFVARTPEFISMANDICMHIAALKPLYLNPEDVDQKFLEHEKEITREQLANSGKPEKIIEQIVNGKVQKLYDEICLMRQTFVKNDQKTITDILTDLMAKTGEKIQIKQFSRFEIGA
jgi:elongation factor Ts